MSQHIVVEVRHFNSFYLHSYFLAGCVAEPHAQLRARRPNVGVGPAKPPARQRQALRPGDPYGARARHGTLPRRNEAFRQEGHQLAVKVQGEQEAKPNAYSVNSSV